MPALYLLFIYLYYSIIRIVSLRNKKARAWIGGRKELFEHLTGKIAPDDKVVWVHCASAGEFEQGKPLIEQLRLKYPGYKMLVSFFSPSGYDVARNYAFADIICYLPLDTPANARQFLDIVHPSLAVFVKYDYWYYLLKETSKRQIPLLMVSAVFRKEQLFFKWYGGFYRRMLHYFTWLFVQDDASLKMLKSHNIAFCSISGDTRFDRVNKITETFKGVPLIEQFINNNPCLVAGSTWETDESYLSRLQLKGLKLILAPHVIDPEHIQLIKKLFPDSVAYSNLTADFNSDCLIIDNVGMLSRLYHYATITYIGGGFTKDGVHNVLEPAVYRKPVVYGPNYKKYREAAELIKAGGAFSFSNDKELKQVIEDLIQDPGKLQEVGNAAGDYIIKNVGATNLIVQYIQEKRLLTN